MRKLLAVLPLALIAIWACQDSGVVRVLALSPEASFPTGTSSTVGTSMRITTAGLQPLDSDHRYVAWSISADGPMALGTLHPDTSLTLTEAEAMTSLGSIDAIEITEEAAGTALPSSPSDRLRMKGDFGGALAYTGLDQAEVHHATGTAQIVDGHVSLTTKELPALSAGLGYCLYAYLDASKPADSMSTLVQRMNMGDGGTMGDAGTAAKDAGAAMPDAGAAAKDAGMAMPDAGTAARDAGMAMPDGGSMAGNDAGMDMTSDAGDDMGAMDMQVVQLGCLDDSGSVQADLPYAVSGLSELFITIQSEHGTQDASPVKLLSGEMQLPTSSGAPEHNHMH